MNHDGGIFTRFDHFVQVADCAAAHRPSEWSVHPDGVVARQKIASDKIGGGKILMARDGHQRQFQSAARARCLSIDPPSHVFDEARLAAAGRSFQQHGQARFVGRFEHLYLIG
jgi:hypothetical protein